MYYPVPVQHVPMPNEPQESVSHMNRYQNFYRPTHFVQSQPMAMVSDSQCVQVPQQQPEHSHQLPSESELTSHDNNKCIDTNSSVKQFSSDIPSSDTGKIYIYYFFFYLNIITRTTNSFHKCLVFVYLLKIILILKKY